MLQFLLDTDHLTLLQHDHAPVMQRLAAGSSDSVGICPVSIEEILRGRLATLGRVLAGSEHVRAYGYLVDAVEMFRRFPIVPFDDPSETHFQYLRKARLRVGTLDLKIASIALAHRLKVLTRNRSDFGRVPGLTIEDWSA